MTTTVAPARRPRPSKSKIRPQVASDARLSGRRWVIAIRQSKKKRDARGTATTISIEVQESRCRQVITSIDDRPTVVEVVIDHGRSGAHGQNRPGRQRLLELVESGQADAVMTFTADRLGRDLEESENLWNRCSKAGAVVRATDVNDLSDPIIRGSYFSRAQKDLETRSYQSLLLLDRRRAAGQPPTKTASAFGMRWKGDTIVPHAREFAIVKDVFTRFDAGETMGSIARSLTKRRVKRRNGSTLWDTASVSNILYCSWYVGLLPDGCKPDGSARYWDAGVCHLDVGLWEQVQRRLIRAGATRLHKAHALSGLLFCGICESWSPMTLCYSKNKRTDGSFEIRDRYRCTMNRTHKDLCPGQSVDGIRLEELLLPHLKALMEHPAVVQARLVSKARAADEGVVERITSLQQQKKVIEGQRSRLADLVVDGNMPADQYRRKSDEVEAAYGRVAEALATLQQAAGPSPAALQRMQRQLTGDSALTSEHWFTASPTRRSELLQLAFPNGLFVLESQPGTARGSVEGRIALRRAEDAADARERYRASLM